MKKIYGLISIRKIIFPLVAVSLIFCKDLSAQSQWLDYGKGNSVSIEIYKPFKSRDSITVADPPGITPGFTAGSGAVFLSGRYVISKKFTLVGEFPMANGKYDDTIDVADEGGFKIGNPYLGAEYYLPRSPLMFELGFRLPFTPDDKIQASLAGIRSDFDRSEAFIREIVPVYAAMNFESLSESNILLKARAGIDLWFNTKKIGLDNQPQLSIDYTLQAGYNHEYVNILLGITGRYNTDTGPKFPEPENISQYGLLVTFHYKNIRPGLSLKVPGSNAAKQFTKYVLGLNFTYEIP